MKTILLCLLLVSCASYKGKIPYETEEGIFYSDDKSERHEAHAYVPKSGDNLPGVILVHGGGWNSRSLSDIRSVGKSLASHGYTVLSINYRFAPKDKHPAQIEDLKEALEFFKKNALRFKLDPKKIGLWGYSSGAHIVSLFALKEIGTVNAVQAVVSGGGPYDLTWYPKSPIITPFIGHHRDQGAEPWFDASPTYHVKKGAPPFFLYHAKNDRLVEYQQMAAFEGRLEREGAFVKTYTIPFWGHAFGFIFSDEAVKKGISFLDRKLK